MIQLPVVASEVLPCYAGLDSTKPLSVFVK